LGMRTIHTTYRYRLEPTDDQAAQMRQFAGARRWVWNWALGGRKERFAKTHTSLSYNALAAELTALKQQRQADWLRRVDSQALPRHIGTTRPPPPTCGAHPASRPSRLPA